MIFPDFNFKKVLEKISLLLYVESVNSIFAMKVSPSEYDGFLIADLQDTSVQMNPFVLTSATTMFFNC